MDRADLFSLRDDGSIEYYVPVSDLDKKDIDDRLETIRAFYAKYVHGPNKPFAARKRAEYTDKILSLLNERYHDHKVVTKKPGARFVGFRR